MKSEIVSVIALDARNDLALLLFPPNPTGNAVFGQAPSVRQGDAAMVVGFPLRGLLASGVNVTTGTVSALAGLGDDTRFLRITAPVQPGSSGGPLLDMSGNVIGVVVGKLDTMEIAKVTGDIPQNVNFTIKASVPRSFLEANDVSYETAPSDVVLLASGIAASAKRFAVSVECWK